MRFFEFTSESTNDSKFTGFMNQTLGQKVDQPASNSVPDFIKNAPIRGLDSLGYRAALNFGLQTLKKLSPSQKTKLSTRGEDGVTNWLTQQAKKIGLIPNQFVEEDLDEAQDFLSEIFKDPAIKSWALVLTDGEPLPKPPAKGPFTVSINKGLPRSEGFGYSNAEWQDVDTLENLPDAVNLARGLAAKNPTLWVIVSASTGRGVEFIKPLK